MPKPAYLVVTQSPGTTVEPRGGGVLPLDSPAGITSPATTTIAPS